MKLTMDTNKLMTLALCLFAAYALMLVPTGAMASDSDTIGSLLCGVAAWFTGRVGQGIATLAIIVIGIGALMGKVSWGMAIIVGIGVAVIFGAPVIVGELSTDAGLAGC